MRLPGLEPMAFCIVGGPNSTIVIALQPPPFCHFRRQVRYTEVHFEWDEY